MDTMRGTMAGAAAEHAQRVIALLRGKGAPITTPPREVDGAHAAVGANIWHPLRYAYFASVNDDTAKIKAADATSAFFSALTDERVNELAAAYKIPNYAATYAAELAKGADVGRTYANQLLARISLNLDAYQVHLEPEAYLNLPVLAVALEQHASVMPFTCKTQEWVRHDTPPTELSCMSCPPLTRSDWEADTLMDPSVYSWLYMAPHGCARCNPLPNWARWPCPMTGSPRPSLTMEGMTRWVDGKWWGTPSLWEATLRTVSGPWTGWPEPWYPSAPQSQSRALSVAVIGHDPTVDLTDAYWYEWAARASARRLPGLTINRNIRPNLPNVPPTCQGFCSRGTCVHCAHAQCAAAIRLCVLSADWRHRLQRTQLGVRRVGNKHQRGRAARDAQRAATRAVSDARSASYHAWSQSDGIGSPVCDLTIVIALPGPARPAGAADARAQRYLTRSAHRP